MVLGVPIAFVILISSLCIMLYMGNFDAQIVASNVISGARSFSLMAIPLFVLAGSLMNSAGISKRIIEFAMSTVGHIRGGMGYVAIIASLIFSGLSGSAIADTAALGAILIPMMVKAGYSRNRSTALIASGGNLANIIPPSIPLILFGVTSGVSISKLFMAGIVPGLLLALFLALAWAWVMRKEDVERQPRKSFKEMLFAARNAVWSLGLPVIILVGLRGGLFTPTEAGAFAVFYALLLGFVVYRELKLKDLIQALVSTAKTTSVVIFLVAAAKVIGWLITVANIPNQLIGVLGPLAGNQTLLMFTIVLIIIIIGTVMDLVPNVLILTPVLMPIVTLAGIDPVYFGVVFILANTVGLLTPPVGSVMSVACSVGKIDMLDIYKKGMLPFLSALLLLLLLLILFPSILLVPLEWLT